MNTEREYLQPASKGWDRTQSVSASRRIARRSGATRCNGHPSGHPSSKGKPLWTRPAVRERISLTTEVGTNELPSLRCPRFWGDGGACPPTGGRGRGWVLKGHGRCPTAGSKSGDLLHYFVMGSNGSRASKTGVTKRSIVTRS